MIGAGTMRAERYGRVVGDPAKRARRERDGLSARPADGDRLRPARPAMGRAAVHRGPRRGGDLHHRPRSTRRRPRRRLRSCARARGSTSAALMTHLRTARNVRALLCEGGPRLHAQLHRGRAGRRVVRNPRPEHRRWRRARTGRRPFRSASARSRSPGSCSRSRPANSSPATGSGADRSDFPRLTSGISPASSRDSLAPTQHPQSEDRRRPAPRCAPRLHLHAEQDRRASSRRPRSSSSSAASSKVRPIPAPNGIARGRRKALVPGDERRPAGAEGQQDAGDEVVHVAATDPDVFKRPPSRADPPGREPDERKRAREPGENVEQ